MNAKTPSHLEKFAPTSPTDGSPEDEVGLPSFAENEYQAHARPANKALFAIHLLKPGGNGKTFEYVDLRSVCDADKQDFDNSRFRLAFIGMRPVIVTVEGRNLLRLYDYIHQHRMAWIMEAAAGRDFQPNNATIITSIKVVACDATALK